MFHLTRKGNLISLPYVFTYLKQIKYFTVSEEGVLTSDENGDNPRFKEWIYSDEVEYRNFLEALKEYKIKEFTPEEWFMRTKVSDKFKDQYFYRVLIYEFNETTKNILINSALNVSFRNKEYNLLHLPQDLCFFDGKGELLMGTLSHMDYVALIKLDSGDDKEFLQYGFKPIDEEIVLPKLDYIKKG